MPEHLQGSQSWFCRNNFKKEEEFMSSLTIRNNIIILSFLIASSISARQGRPLAKISVDENGHVELLERYDQTPDTNQKMSLPDEKQGIKRSDGQIKNSALSKTTAIPMNSATRSGNEMAARGTNLTLDTYSWSFSYPDLSISVTIINNSDNPAGASVVGFYLSSDQEITFRDYPLGQKQVPALMPLETSTQTNQMDIAHKVGTWYWGISIDCNNEVNEIDEDDNVFVETEPVEIGPDLVMIMVDLVWANVVSIDEHMVEWRVTIANHGNQEINCSLHPFSTYLYLSEDTNITPSDFKVTGFPMATGMFVEDQQVTQSSQFATNDKNDNIPEGEYYLGAIVDAENSIQESDETNNTGYDSSQKAVVSSSHEPNLTYVLPNNYSYVNPDLTINVRVKNVGPKTAVPCRLGYYLSADHNIQTSDQLIGTDDIPFLAGAAYSDENITQNVSGYPGSWWVGCIIDDLDEVSESDENDNLWASESPIGISELLPDLVVTDVQVAEIDSGYQMNYSIKNMGNLATNKTFTTQLFLSTDENITLSDLPMMSWTQESPLNPGEFINSAGIIIIPGFTAPSGEYYWGAYVDIYNDVNELNENNNTGYADSPRVTIPDGINHSSESIIVTNTHDSGDGSFRNAIDQANQSPSPDSILFNIPLSDPGYDDERGVWTIHPLTALPVISDSLTLIDGLSQQDFTGDTNPSGLEIELDGSEIAGGSAHGLIIMSAQNTVQGLAINRFPNSGILLTGPGANENELVNNFIGLSAAIDTLLPNGNYGIYIIEGARNQIGRLEEMSLGKANQDKQTRLNIPHENLQQEYEFTGQNIIAGNLDCGIFIFGETANGNQIVNNQIIYNESHGIFLSDRVKSTTIYWNAIADNAGAGVVVHGENAIQNSIISNYITENGLEGIRLDDGNFMLQAPEIQAVTDTSISGICCPDAQVQLFSDPEDEGQFLFGEALSDASGNFSWTGMLPENHITATATDPSGNTSEFSAPIGTGVEAKTTESVPNAFALYQNFPNPFNPATIIHYYLPKTCEVNLSIYNLRGQKVITLVSERQPAGTYQIEWQAGDQPNGIYLYHLKADDYSEMKKLILQK
jgi:hypothetical protein